MHSERMSSSSNNGYSNANQFYQTNTFTNIGTAFLLWPTLKLLPNGTLTDCMILNNTIIVDVKDYINYWMNGVTQATFVGTGGITENNANGPGPTNGLTIDSNTITFTNYSGVTIAYPAMCNGISLHPLGRLIQTRI